METTETAEISETIIEAVDNVESPISKDVDADQDEKPIRRFSWLFFLGIFFSFYVEPACKQVLLLII